MGSLERDLRRLTRRENLRQAISRALVAGGLASCVVLAVAGGSHLLAAGSHLLAGPAPAWLWLAMPGAMLVGAATTRRLTRLDLAQRLDESYVLRELLSTAIAAPRDDALTPIIRQSAEARWQTLPPEARRAPLRLSARAQASAALLLAATAGLPVLSRPTADGASSPRVLEVASDARRPTRDDAGVDASFVAPVDRARRGATSASATTDEDGAPRSDARGDSPGDARSEPRSGARGDGAAAGFATSGATSDVPELRTDVESGAPRDGSANASSREGRGRAREGAGDASESDGSGVAAREDTREGGARSGRPASSGDASNDDRDERYTSREETPLDLESIPDAYREIVRAYFEQRERRAAGPVR